MLELGSTWSLHEHYSPYGGPVYRDIVNACILTLSIIKYDTSEVFSAISFIIIDFGYDCMFVNNINCVLSKISGYSF